MARTREFSAEGRTYTVDIGCPETISRIEPWRTKMESLIVTGDEITIEQYDRIAGFVRCVIGDAQFDEAFCGGRDVFLLMEIVIHSADIIREINEKTEAIRILAESTKSTAAEAVDGMTG